MRLTKLQKQMIADYSVSDMFYIGPVSPDLLKRARGLVEKGLLTEQRPTPGKTMSAFRLTPAGESVKRAALVK